MYDDIIGYQRAGYAPPAQMGLVIDPATGNVVQPQGYAPVAYADGQPFDAVIQRPVQQSQMGIAERTALKCQRQWYGFPRTKICPGEVVKLVGQAQVLMKIIRIFIDDSINASLLVTSLVIAKNDLINGDAVSGTLFGPLVTDAYPQTETETIQPGCSATITLENIGDTEVLAIVSARVAVCW